jgi:hypothetical protein
MANRKNPTALFFQRMATIQKDANGQPQGVLASLLTKFFHDNYGKTNLPKVAADFALYDQKTTGGALTTQFFTGAYSANNANMPGGSYILPESEHAVIMGIRVLSGSNAALLSTDWQYGVSDAVSKQGYLTIQTNGQTVLTKLPLTAFNPNQLGAAIAGVTSDDQGMYWLMEPLVWLGQTDMIATLNFPAAPAANANIRIEYHGVRFIGS